MSILILQIYCDEPYVRLLGAIASAMVLAAGCGSPKLQEFSSSEGRFKALMPGTPKETAWLNAGKQAKMYMVELGKTGAYGISFADVNASSDAPDSAIQAFFDATSSATVHGAGGSIVSSSKITLDGLYPGREVGGELSDQRGLLRARFYLVGTRLYQIMVLGQESTVKSTSADSFLASLQLTSDPSKPDFKKFSPPGGQFTVLMPGIPEEQVRTVKGVETKMYVVDEKDGVFEAGFADAEISIGSDPQAAIDAARDRAVGNMKGKVLNSKNISLDNQHLGTEFEAEIPQLPGLYCARMFLVGKRLYHVAVFGKGTRSRPAVATKFLDSFELTK